jgi:hypothetical protein
MILRPDFFYEHHFFVAPDATSLPAYMKVFIIDFIQVSSHFMKTTDDGGSI